MAYTRTYVIDATPGGDTVKGAVATKLDGDLTNAYTYLNAHDIATTNVHGFTGAKTGSGAMVGATTPTLVTPVLGVATATSINGLTITSSTGTFTLTAAKTLAVTNTLTLSGTDSTVMTFPSTSATIARTDAANTFTGHQTIEGVTSTGATGTGKLVFDTTPTLATPILGVATVTSVNKVTITAPATTAVLTIAEGKTFTCSNTLTLTATDSSTLAIGTGGTLGTAAYTAATAYEASGAITTHAALITGVHGLVFTAGKTLTLTESLTFNAGGAGALRVATAANTIGNLAVGLATQILVGGGAGTVPAWGTDIPTAVTIGSAYITRVGGTDVTVADGGTGVSTLALNGVLYGKGTAAVGVTAIGAAGDILVAGADPFVPVWAAGTGTGAPVRATSPTITTPALAIGSDADGDMYYRASSVLARLAKGAANLKMFMNAGATAPEWATGLKVTSFNRDLAAASGDVAYTGIGFKPNVVLFSGGVNTASVACILGMGTDSLNLYLADYTSGNYVRGASCIGLMVDTGNYQTAVIKTMDADGFTLTWTKVNAPTGTATIHCISLR